MVYFLFILKLYHMRGSRTFFQRGSNFLLRFLVVYGREDPKTNKSGPIDDPTLNAGL